MLFFANELLYMPELFALALGVALLALSLLRTVEGLKVLTYQAQLTHSKLWSMDVSNMPRMQGQVYLGEGFKWIQKHTQRLLDTKRPESQKYLFNDFHPLKVLFAKLGLKNEKQSLFLGNPPVSGRPELHGVELRKQAVWLNSADRVGHTLVLGTTRVGKTRLSELLVAQDIRDGNVVLVFDPKGDVDLLRRTYAESKRWGRERDFMMFHLGYPQHSCRYNAIGRFSRITEVATRIAAQLPGGGSSAAFREFAWRFVNIITHALVALRYVPNYIKIRKYINDIEPLFVEYARNYLMRTQEEGWAAEVRETEKSINARNLSSSFRGRDLKAIALYQYIDEKNIEEPVLEGLMSAFKYDRTYFDKIVSSVGPLMEKLTTGPVAELISPSENESDQRPMLEWMDVIRNKKIVYVGLDALSDTTVAGAVGNSMFADLVSVAGYLYKFGIHGEGKPFEEPPRICIHADEFNELIGDEFVPLLNKAGGAGFQVTAYTQTSSDIEARVGNRAKTGQITGNFNTLIMLRVKELATAELLTKQLPKVEVRSLTESTSASDSRDPSGSNSFTSKNDDRLSITELPMLSPSDIVALPRGQAFALLEGGTLWKIKFPMPSKRDDCLPKTLEHLLSDLQERYGKAAGDVTNAGGTSQIDQASLQESE